jgi:hypothetical protein
MRIFIPIEDASVDHSTDVLVPYRQGLACAHELRGGLILRDGVWSERPPMSHALLDHASISDESSARRPASIPVSSPDRH